MSDTNGLREKLERLFRSHSPVSAYGATSDQSADRAIELMSDDAPLTESAALRILHGEIDRALAIQERRFAELFAAAVVTERDPDDESRVVVKIPEWMLRRFDVWGDEEPSE